MVAELHPSDWVAPTAVITGDVTIGPGSRVLHGAVYGVPRGTSMREIMRRQSEHYGPNRSQPDMPT